MTENEQVRQQIKDDTGRPLAWRIAQLRRERGWSTKELADLLGISVRHLESRTSGRYRYSVADLVLLARTWDMTLDDLVRCS